MYLLIIDLNVKLEELECRVCYLFQINFFHLINQDCDVRSAACRQRIDARGNGINSRQPNFASKTKKCDYEDQKFWLIPGGNSNSSCCKFLKLKFQRFKVSARIARDKPLFRILDHTVNVSPDPIRLPACFDINFEVILNNNF